MNSKQRRKQQRIVERMAYEFLGILEEMVDDIDAGETTTEDIRREIPALKEALSDAGYGRR